MEDVARCDVGLAFDHDTRTERMAVDTRIRRFRRSRRQEMGCLELELFVNAY